LEESPHSQDHKSFDSTASTVKDLSESKKPEDAVTTSQWGEGWKTPILMYGLYVCGESSAIKIHLLLMSPLLALITAVVHLVFFLIMDGKPTDGENTISQTYVSAISQLLAKLFKVTLCASLALAFTQHLWRVLRKSLVKVSNIERLFGIRENIFLMAHPGPLKTAPLLFLLALVGWLVPIAVLYPPGALIVVSRTTSRPSNATVPTFNASARDSNGLDVFSSQSAPARETLVGPNGNGPYNFILQSVYLCTVYYTSSLLFSVQANNITTDLAMTCHRSLDRLCS
jgi:hypothetical protein